MLFNSVVFLLFAFIFFAFWPLAKGRRNIRWAYITVASFIFYGWWDWRFLFLLIGTGTLDFYVGLTMPRYPRWKHLLLTASLIANVGSLAIFKYGFFFASNLDRALLGLGYDTHLAASLPGFFLILPAGISFYTFHAMSYTIDVYRGRCQPTNNLLHFLAYLTMFPQLVAGPIVRARHMLPQLENARTPTELERWTGMKLIAFGYFKKMAVADNLAPFVNDAFGAITLSDSSAFWWIVVTAFAFQIYFDFAGYSNIARGLARWMGYEYVQNFDHPYTSTSLQEFWRRWHISLSTWFRDYLYISLGGSRVSKWRSLLNVWITMVVSGLWHGAAWNFVIWGAIHSFFFSIERLTHWPRWVKNAGIIGRALAAIFVIAQVWAAWVFFRAETTPQAFQIVRTMLSFSGTLTPGDLDIRAGAFLAIGILRELQVFLALGQPPLASPRWQNSWEVLFVAGLLFASIFLRGPGSQFIYFQF